MTEQQEGEERGEGKHFKKEAKGYINHKCMEFLSILLWINSFFLKKKSKILFNKLKLVRNQRIFKVD